MEVDFMGAVIALRAGKTVYAIDRLGRLSSRLTIRLPLNLPTGWYGQLEWVGDGVTSPSKISIFDVLDTRYEVQE